MVPRPCAVEYRYRGIAELQLQARKQPVYLLTLLVAGLLAALSWVTREPGDPIVGREVRLLLVVLIVGGFVSWILGVDSGWAAGSWGSRHCSWSGASDGRPWQAMPSRPKRCSTSPG